MCLDFYPKRSFCLNFLKMAVLFIPRCYRGRCWSTSQCLVKCVAVYQFRNGSRLSWCQCTLAVLAFSLWLSILAESSCFGVLQSSRKCWAIYSGTWLASTEEGCLVSEGRPRSSDQRSARLGRWHALPYWALVCTQNPASSSKCIIGFLVAKPCTSFNPHEINFLHFWGLFLKEICSPCPILDFCHRPVSNQR